MKYLTTTVSTWLILGCLGTAVADGTVEAGKTRVATCAACHGMDGCSVNPEIYPRLSGQGTTYLATAIREYQDGTRKNEPMNLIVASLSEQDVADISAYYASLKCE